MLIEEEANKCEMEFKVFLNLIFFFWWSLRGMPCQIGNGVMYS